VLIFGLHSSFQLQTFFTLTQIILYYCTAIGRWTIFIKAPHANLVRVICFNTFGAFYDLSQNRLACLLYSRVSQNSFSKKKTQLTVIVVSFCKGCGCDRRRMVTGIYAGDYHVVSQMADLFEENPFDLLQADVDELSRLLSSSHQYIHRPYDRMHFQLLLDFHTQRNKCLC